MKNLTHNRAKVGDVTLSNTLIDESVLEKANYKLADFTVDGFAYAINTDNSFAYRLIGKRKSEKHGMLNTVLTLEDLKK